MAITGLPPFGVFMSEFLLISGAFTQAPVLTVIAVAGLLLALGALLLRLTAIAFGAPLGPATLVRASYAPIVVHLGLVLVAGLYLPGAFVTWFQTVAGLLK